MTVHDSIAEALADLPDASTRADDVAAQLITDGFAVVDSAWIASVREGANGPSQVPGQTLRNIIANEPAV